MTVSAWVNSRGVPRDDAAIVSKRSGRDRLPAGHDDRPGPRTIGFKLTNSSGGEMFRYGATTLQPTPGTTSPASTTLRATLHVYLNGQLDDGTLVGTVTSTQQNSTANVNIGRRAGCLLQFQRSHDDVRIYRWALSRDR